SISTALAASVKATATPNPDGSWTLSAVSTGNPVIKWFWKALSGTVGPFIATGSKITLKAVAPGNYSFQVMATDNQWNSYAAVVNFTVAAAVTPPRTVISLSVNLFGNWITVPISCAKFTFSDGSTQ